MRGALRRINEIRRVATVIAFTHMLFYFVAVGNGGEVAARKVYRQLISDAGAEFSASNADMDVTQLLLILNGTTPSSTPARKQAAIVLAKTLPEDKVPVEDCHRLAMSDLLDVEFRTLAVTLLAKGALSEVAGARSQELLFEIARDRAINDEVRASAVFMLILFGPSRNAVLRECNRILRDAETPSSVVGTVCHWLLAASIEFSRFDLDVVANLFVGVVDESPSEARTAELMSALSDVRLYDRTMTVLSSQTLVDLHRVGEREFNRVENREASRLIGLYLLNSDFSVTEDTLKACDALLADPFAPVILKGALESRIKRIKSQQKRHR